MKKEVEQAIQYCIDALALSKEENEKEQTYSDLVQNTLQKIAMLPYQGRNLGIGDFCRTDYRSSFHDMMPRLLDKPLNHSLTWKNALLTLFDYGNYTEDNMLQLAKGIQDNIIFNHVLKHIITNCVVLGNTEKAENLIPNFRPSHIFKEHDNMDMGYLILLKHYALQGNDKCFFKYFKLSKPAQNKTEVHNIKNLLVYHFSENNDIADSIALCSHRSIGHKYIFNALLPYADKGQYMVLQGIFNRYPELKQPEKHTELRLLDHAYAIARKQQLDIPDDFDLLFSRAIDIDRKLKHGDMTLRDALLLDLGLASSDSTRVQQCKKAIKSQWVKSELVA